MLHKILKNLINIPGFKTKRKLVLFVIDDYGSIRMPSIEAYNKLANNGINWGDCRFSKYETIESNTDLEELFNVLTSFKDVKGNHFVFTPMACIANPNFEKIVQTIFQEYHYELFPQTLEKYPNHDKVFALWNKGIELGIFVPQFHNREHLNVKRWMQDLVSNNLITKAAFNEKMFSLSSIYSSQIKWEYQPALEIDKLKDLENQKLIIADGLNQFEKLFNYKAIHFTPPNATINHNLYGVLKEGGISFIDSPRIEKETLGNNKYKRHFHYIGQKHKSGLNYLVRNAVFEPNDNPDFDSISKCMYDIETAFKFNQPAVISSHRVNFSGELYPINREKGLKSLSELIKKIQLKWPEVEFISTNELSNLIVK
jgi:hypothetical protein